MAGIIYCQKMEKGNQLREKYAKKRMVRLFYLTICIRLCKNYECGLSISPSSSTKNCSAFASEKLIPLPSLS